MDEKSVGNLIDEYKKQIFTYVKQYCPKVYDKYDAFQEVALYLFSKQDYYDTARPFLPWAKMLCCQFFSRYKGQPGQEHYSIPYDERYHMEFQAEEQTVFDLRVDAILSQLSPPYKHVLVDTFTLGLTPAQIAELQGCESSVIRSRLYKAKESFRKKWEAQFGEWK